MMAQIKTARDLLGITQEELCNAAGIRLITLRRLEGGRQHGDLVSDATVAKVRAALEARGIQFLEREDASDGEGVALQWSD